VTLAPESPGPRLFPRESGVQETDAGMMALIGVGTVTLAYEKNGRAAAVTVNAPTTYRR
jgi:hypothetical protein